jgi:hypothetical protein
MIVIQSKKFGKTEMFKLIYNNEATAWSEPKVKLKNMYEEMAFDNSNLKTDYINNINMLPKHDIIYIDSQLYDNWNKVSRGFIARHCHVIQPQLINTTNKNNDFDY